MIARLDRAEVKRKRREILVDVMVGNKRGTPSGQERQFQGSPTPRVRVNLTALSRILRSFTWPYKNIYHNPHNRGSEFPYPRDERHGTYHLSESFEYRELDELVFEIRIFHLQNNRQSHSLRTCNVPPLSDFRVLGSWMDTTQNCKPVDNLDLPWGPCNCG